MSKYSVRIYAYTWVDRVVEADSEEEAIRLGRETVWKSLAAGDLMDMFERIMPLEVEDRAYLLSDEESTSPEWKKLNNKDKGSAQVYSKN